MGSIEEQLNNVNNKDEMIKWLVNEYQYLSDKAYGMVHKDIRQREMDIIKGKADELMNEDQTESNFHNKTIETSVKGAKITISGKTIEEIIKEQLEEVREKTKPIIKAMYEIQRNFDKLDKKDKDEILEMLGNKNKSKEDDKKEIKKTYKYEQKVTNILRNLGALYNSNINFRMADEVKEVYAKAEALNEIINLLKASHSDYAEDVLEDIGVIVMDYWEDTNNE